MPASTEELNSALGVLRSLMNGSVRPRRVLELAERSTTRWPPWLDLLQWVMQHRAEFHDEVEWLLDAQADLAQRLTAELDPSLCQAMQRASRVAAFSFGVTPRPPDCEPADAEERLLARALESPTGGDLTPLDRSREVQLDILLADDVGHVATLRLRRLLPADGPGHARGFVRAPSSFLLRTHSDEGSFPSALATAAAAIAFHLEDGAPAPIISWDLQAPFGRPLTSVSGSSAGAAFALAGLSLVRTQARPELRRHLQLIDWTKTAISAALAGRSGRLLAVGRLREKLGAWFEVSTARLNPRKVFVAQRQAAGHLAERCIGCGSLAELAKAVADHTGEQLDDDQRALLDVLLDPADPPPDRDLLRRVAGPGKAVTGWRGYLLRRWARASLAHEFHLDRFYVQLRLDAPRSGPGPDDAAAAHPGLPYTSLASLLADRPIDEARGWLITGAPGAGKTTLLHHHEMTVAQQALRELDAGAEVPGEIGLFVSLKGYPAAEPDFGRWLRETYWPTAAAGMPPMADVLRGHSGHMRLLLDGINEINLEGGGTRQQGANRIVAWCEQQGANMLAPIFSVREYDRSFNVGSSEFPVLEASVLHWPPAQQRDYCERRLGAGNALWPKLQGNPRLLDLCSLPMNMHNQCTLFQQHGVVAVNRAELFSGLLWLRLRREYQAGRLATQGLAGASLEPLLRQQSQTWKTRLLDLPASSLVVEGLDRVGYALLDAHGGNAREIGIEPVFAALEEARIVDALRDAWLQAVENLGLAFRSEDRTSFGFAHQLWGEFFAARRLAFGNLEGVGIPKGAALKDLPRVPLEEALKSAKDSSQALATNPASAWEETVKLAVQLAREPTPPVAWLTDANPPLAGRAAAAALRGRVEAATLDRLRERLLEICTGPTEPDLRIRVEAGLALGELGDTLRYVWMPFGDKPVCLLPRRWVEVKKGDYSIGSEPGDAEAYDNERPVVQVRLERFWMACAPVTNAEYRCFVEAKDYLDERWWQGNAAREWLRRQDPKEPVNWNVARYNNPLQPVVGVSLYEALAYARWLSEAGGHSVRLPTEAEWEAAVRGKQRRTYAWGEDKPDAQRCNWLETRLNCTSPVGAFPRSNSPEGLVDAAGNCREWTTSELSGKGHDAGRLTGRTDAESKLPRAVRGAGFWRNVLPRDLRAAYRNGDVPDFRYDDRGIRLVSAAPFLVLGP